MYLIILTALTAVCAEPFRRGDYLPPVPCCKNNGATKTFFRTSAFKESAPSVPAGGFTNDFQGVVVDADSYGSSRIAPNVDSALGRPRDSYGSTNSKVGEAAFKTTFGASSGQLGPGTRIAPGFESIISGSDDGSNDFKIGEASYKIAPGLLTDDSLKVNEQNAENPFSGDKQSGEAVFTNNFEKNQHTYEYQTNKGIKGGGNGVNIHGTQIDGSHSYKPHGDHLPTPPPTPVEIIKSVEENIREEAAGHYDDGSYNAHLYNKGNSENLPHNSNPHLGSIHGTIGTINHSTLFGNKFGKPESNQVNKNNQVVNNIGTSQVQSVNIPQPISAIEINKESSLTTLNRVNDGVSSGSTQSSVTGETSQFSGHVNNFGSTTTTLTQESTESQEIKPALPVKFGGTATTEQIIHNGGLHHSTVSAIKPGTGYHYDVPLQTYEFHKTNRFSHFGPQNTEEVNSGHITSKPVGISETSINQGSLNTQQVQLQSGLVQTTSDSKPNTISNLNNYVTHTSQSQVHKEFGSNIRPTAVSSTGTPSFTSNTNLQPSEEILVTSTQDITKTQQQTGTGTISIVPTKHFSTLSTYDSSSQTQTQFPAFNNGRPNKYSQTLDISKPVNTFSSPLHLTNPSFMGSTSYTGYNTNVFTSNSTSSQLNGHVTSLSLKPLDKAQPELNQNLKPENEIFNYQTSQISTQTNLHSRGKDVSNLVSNVSSVPSPATPLNYLIEENSHQHKGPSSIGVNPNTQTTSSFASAFASSGLPKPQISINDGKYRPSTTKSSVVQGSDYSYFYNKPSKPFIIPVVPNFISKESTLSQVSKTDQKPIVSTTSEKQTNSISSQITQSQSQATKIENIQTDKTYSQTSSGQTPVPVNSQSVDPFAGSITQQNGYSQTSLGVTSTKPQSHFLSQPLKPVISSETTSVTNLNKFGLTQFGTQFKPSLGQQQKTEIHEYNKPIVSSISGKETSVDSGLITQTSQTSFGTVETGSHLSKPSFVQNTQTNIGIQSVKPQQINVGKQTFGQNVQTNTPSSSIHFGGLSTKPQFSQTQIVSQPVRNIFGQTTFNFNNTQNKYGLTQFGAQQFKPSSGYSQQSRGELYEYNKPKESLIINNQANAVNTQVGQTQSQVTQVSQTSLSSIKPGKVQTLQKETASTQNIHNVPNSSFHANSPFGLSKLGQTHFGAQTVKPTFGQKIQTNTATTSTQFGVASVKPQVIQTQIVSQPAKVTFGQSTFSSTQNKYGLTQFGTQKFKPSLAQTQQSGEFYHNKPAESVTTNKESNIIPSQVSQIQTQIRQSSLSTVQPSQVKPGLSQTGTTHTQLNTQNVHTSPFHTNSQSGKPQFGQTNFGTQVLKPTFGQTSTTSTTTQFGVASVKPQLSQTQFISQPAKGNFGQSVFGSTQNKYSLTQFGAQKPSTDQLQHSTGELYEYKKPTDNITTNKDTNIFNAQLSQNKAQTSIPFTQSVQLQPVSLQTGTKTSQSLNTQNVPTSTFQLNSQAPKPQFGQTNFESQSFLQTNTGVGVTSAKPHDCQTQFVSQPAKVAFDQSTISSTTQNKYDLTQLGTQQIDPSLSQEQYSTDELYEYKKPAEILKPDKIINIPIGQISQTKQEVTQVGQTSISSLQKGQAKPETSQTGTASAETFNIQNIPTTKFQSSSQSTKPQFGQTTQTNIATTVTQFGIASLKPQVSPQSAEITPGQSTFTSTQDKHTVMQFGTQKFKPSLSQSEKSTSELYEYKKPTESLTSSKDTSTLGDQISQTQSKVTQVSQTSLPTSSQLQESKEQVSKHPTGCIFTNQGTSTDSILTGSIQTANPQFLSETQFTTQQQNSQIGVTHLGIKPANKFSETLETQTGTSQTTTGQNQNNSGELYIYDKPSISFITGSFVDKEQLSQNTQSKISKENEKINTETQQASQVTTGGSQSTGLENIHSTTFQSTQTKFGFQQNKPSLEHTLETIDKVESGQSQTQVDVNQGKQQSVENNQFSSLHKPGFEHTSVETQFGIHQKTPGHNKATISQKESSTIINTQTGQLISEGGTKDSKLNQLLTASQTESADLQKNPNTLGIHSSHVSQTGTSQTTTGQNQNNSGELYIYNKPSISFITGSFVDKEKLSQNTQSKISKENEKINTGTQQASQATTGVSQSTGLENIHSTTFQSTQTKFGFQQNKPSLEHTLETIGKVESGQSQTQVGVDQGKQQSVENNQFSSLHKPGFEHTIVETQFGIHQKTPGHNKAIISQKESSTLINTQTGQLISEGGTKDSELNQLLTASQTKSTDLQKNPNTLGIHSSHVSQSHIGGIQNKMQLTSGTVESLNSQTQLGIQSFKPIPCQSSLTENNRATSQVTGETTNQQSNLQVNQISLQAAKPVSGQNSFGSSDNNPSFGYHTQQFGYGQKHEHYYPHYHHQHGYPYSHGYPHHHDFAHPHNFPHQHDYHDYHHHGGPGSFGSHYHDFGSQFGHRFDKPFGHYGHMQFGKNHFSQHNFPFGQFNSGFYNKNSNAVATASVGQAEKIAPGQTIENLTKKPFEQTQESFDGTFSSDIFTNVNKDSSLSTQPTKPALPNILTKESGTIVNPTKLTTLNSGTKSESAPSINIELSKTQSTVSTTSQESNVGTLTHTGSSSPIRTEGQIAVPFGKPAFHKFGGGSNAAATAETGPSFGLEYNKEKSNAVAQASVGPGSTEFDGALKTANKYTSNAVATAQSGNAFGQPNTATATATTGPILSNPFNTFDGYTSNAVAKAISGPQSNVSPTKAASGTPSFSNAFASASRDSSFASSFVSSTPVIITASGDETEILKTNVGSRLSTPEFAQVNTAKPEFNTGILTHLSSFGKGEQFGGPRELPKFDGSTGYHY